MEQVGQVGQVGQATPTYQSCKPSCYALFSSMNDASELIERASLIPDEPVPPIESRFLFVDVAALRAKQLRRGARVRFDADQLAAPPQKPERVAMEEVRRGLVDYGLPKPRSRAMEGEA